MTTLVHEIEGDGPRLLCFVHGILGSRRNWLSFARRMVRAHAGWRAVVVDLRAHGDSPRKEAPHTLSACANDLAEMFAHVGEEPSVLIGHSFGGKVALAYARDHAAALDEVVLVDTPPGRTHRELGLQEVERVIGILRDIPLPLADRNALVDALRSRGLSNAIAQWMTTNVTPADGGLVWRFDLDVVRALIDDYGAENFIPYIAQLAGAPHITLVRGGRSDRFTAADVVELQALERAGKLTMHVVPNAGHWLHTDDPVALAHIVDGLVERVSRSSMSP
jgi:esterase